MRLALPKLFHLMTQGNRSTNAVPRRAYLALANLHSDDALELCLPYLSNTNAPNRKQVVDLIARCPLATNAAPAVTALIRCLTVKDNAVRRSAAYALSQSHFRPDLVVPALTNSLATSTNLRFRIEALWVLGEVGRSQAQPVTPFLLAELQDSEPTMRLQAANALGKLGAQATAALPLLTNLLSDPIVHVTAGDAIERITHAAPTNASPH